MDGLEYYLISHYMPFVSTFAYYRFYFCNAVSQSTILSISTGRREEECTEL